jgi:hypothetical protein
VVERIYGYGHQTDDTRPWAAPHNILAKHRAAIRSGWVSAPLAACDKHQRGALVRTCALDFTSASGLTGGGLPWNGWLIALSCLPRFVASPSKRNCTSATQVTAKHGIRWQSEERR